MIAEANQIRQQMGRRMNPTVNVVDMIPRSATSSAIPRYNHMLRQVTDEANILVFSLVFLAWTIIWITNVSRDLYQYLHRAFWNSNLTSFHVRSITAQFRDKAKQPADVARLDFVGRKSLRNACPSPIQLVGNSWTTSPFRLCSFCCLLMNRKSFGLACTEYSVT